MWPTSPVYQFTHSPSTSLSSFAIHIWKWYSVAFCIFTSKQCYFKMLRLLVLYLHHTLVHLHVFSGREMFKSRRVNTPAQVPQLTIRQLENLAAERKRQSQRQRKKAKDRQSQRQMKRQSQSQNSPCREEANNRVKLLPLTELGGLPWQLRADVDTLGVELSICF